MLYKENKKYPSMKRAPQDLIPKKTAVFWLQCPFCSTSACQLAPLGKGRESRDFFGEQGKKILETGRRMRSSNSREIKIRISNFRTLEWGKCCPEVCTPHPHLHRPGVSGILCRRREFPFQKNPLLSFSLDSRREMIPQKMFLYPIPCSQNKKLLFCYLGKKNIIFLG